MNLFSKIRALPQRISTLERNVERLERVVEFVTASENNAWLYANRMERMDAHLPIFDETRRRFHLARYEFATAYASAKAVADIACGTGYGASLLALTGGAAKVIGVDLDARAVHYARQKYGCASVEFVCSRCDSTGIADESVDVITSFETIEHIPNPKDFVRECRRMLKRNGRLIISTPNGWEEDHNTHHLQHFNLHQFTLLLEGAFELEGIYNQNSGSAWKYNHGQRAGIVLSTAVNFNLAECFIAVCKKA